MEAMKDINKNNRKLVKQEIDMSDLEKAAKDEWPMGDPMEIG